MLVFTEKAIRNIIKMYNNGQSINSIAKHYNTHATTILRTLTKHDVELRHDTKEKGHFYVPNGEKLIEWAKAQGRLVTKTELANAIGKKRLSPSYFLKYPELGQYIVTHGSVELQKYTQLLYDWLQKNNIPYKPNDRTALRMEVTALLLGEYSNTAIQMNIKPSNISKKKFEADTKAKLRSASKNKIFIIWLNENHFKDLDSIRELLEATKS